MARDASRDFGLQPIAGIMAGHGLRSHDLVAASTDQLTHKMVSRAAKGRWLTQNVRTKILKAVNNATGKAYKEEELFNYRGKDDV